MATRTHGGISVTPDSSTIDYGRSGADNLQNISTPLDMSSKIPSAVERPDFDTEQQKSDNLLVPSNALDLSSKMSLSIDQEAYASGNQSCHTLNQSQQSAAASTNQRPRTAIPSQFPIPTIKPKSDTHQEEYAFKSQSSGKDVTTFDRTYSYSPNSIQQSTISSSQVQSTSEQSNVLISQNPSVELHSPSSIYNVNAPEFHNQRGHDYQRQKTARAYNGISNSNDDPDGIKILNVYHIPTSESRREGTQESEQMSLRDNAASVDTLQAPATQLSHGSNVNLEQYHDEYGIDIPDMYRVPTSEYRLDSRLDPMQNHIGADRTDTISLQAQYPRVIHAFNERSGSNVRRDVYHVETRGDTDLRPRDLQQQGLRRHGFDSAERQAKFAHSAMNERMSRQVALARQNASSKHPENVHGFPPNIEVVPPFNHDHIPFNQRQYLNTPAERFRQIPRTSSPLNHVNRNTGDPRWMSTDQPQGRLAARGFSQNTSRNHSNARLEQDLGILYDASIHPDLPRPEPVDKITRRYSFPAPQYGHNQAQNIRREQSRHLGQKYGTTSRTYQGFSDNSFRHPVPFHMPKAYVDQTYGPRTIVGNGEVNPITNSIRETFLKQQRESINRQKQQLLEELEDNNINTVQTPSELKAYIRNLNKSLYTHPKKSRTVRKGLKSTANRNPHANPALTHANTAMSTNQQSSFEDGTLLPTSSTAVEENIHSQVSLQVHSPGFGESMPTSLLGESIPSQKPWSMSNQSHGIAEPMPRSRTSQSHGTIEPMPPRRTSQSHGPADPMPPSRTSHSHGTAAPKPPSRTSQSHGTAAPKPPSRTSQIHRTAEPKPSSGTSHSHGTAEPMPPSRTSHGHGTAETMPPSRTSHSHGTAERMPPSRTSQIHGTAEPMPPSRTSHSHGTAEPMPPSRTSHSHGTAEPMPPSSQRGVLDGVGAHPPNGKMFDSLSVGDRHLSVGMSGNNQQKFLNPKGNVRPFSENNGQSIIRTPRDVVSPPVRPRLAAEDKPGNSSEIRYQINSRPSSDDAFIATSKSKDHEMSDDGETVNLAKRLLSSSKEYFNICIPPQQEISCNNEVSSSNNSTTFPADEDTEVPHVTNEDKIFFSDSSKEFFNICFPPQQETSCNNEESSLNNSTKFPAHDDTEVRHVTNEDKIFFSDSLRPCDERSGDANMLNEVYVLDEITGYLIPNTHVKAMEYPDKCEVLAHSSGTVEPEVTLKSPIGNDAPVETSKDPDSLSVHQSSEHLQVEDERDVIMGKAKGGQENGLKQDKTLTMATYGTGGRVMRRAIVVLNDALKTRTGKRPLNSQVLVVDSATNVTPLGPPPTHLHKRRRRRRTVDGWFRRRRGPVKQCLSTTRRHLPTPADGKTTTTKRRVGRPRKKTFTAETKAMEQDVATTTSTAMKRLAVASLSKTHSPVPTVMQSRTRSGLDRAKNHRLMNDTKIDIITRECEDKREPTKVHQRQGVREYCGSGDNEVRTTGNSNASASKSETTEGTDQRGPATVPEALLVNQEGVNAKQSERRKRRGEQGRERKKSTTRTSSPPSSAKGIGRRRRSSETMRVEFAQNSSNHIKLKFFNIRGVSTDVGNEPPKGQKQQDLIPRRRVGRPPKKRRKVIQSKKISPPKVPEPHIAKEHKGKDNDYDDSKQEIVSYLVDRIVDVDARDNAGYTALHESCVNGDLEVASYLLRHGADVKACAFDGTSPIHVAVDNDRIEIVRLLLAYGADPLLTTYTCKKSIAMTLARSSEMKTLLLGYLRDANRGRTKIDDATKSPIDYHWSFNGSCSLFDKNSVSDTYMFADVPEEEGTTRKPKPDGEEMGIFFEMSEKPLMQSYHLRLEGKERFCNWLLLRDVTEWFSLTREGLLATHPELRPHTLPAGEFNLAIQESQILQSRPRAGQTGSAGVSLHSDPETEVTLLELNDDLRKLLGVESVII